MRQIDDLSKALAKINRDLLAQWTPPSAEAMAKTTNDISQLLAVSVGRKPFDLNSSSLSRAIHAVRDQNAVVDFKTLRLSCHGIGQRFDDYVPLGDIPVLHSLLRATLLYKKEPRRFRRLYDGLLHSYLTAERHADWFTTHSVLEGNEQLRAFLRENEDLIRALVPSPEWVGALTDYPDILSLKPGHRFGNAWIGGNKIVFQDAMQRFGLPGSSWLASETIQSALAIALELDDNAFTRHILSFLEAAIEPSFQTTRDAIYVEIVSRYAAISSAPVHGPLRDALVAAWKNPWLERNDPAWKRVPEAARRMVASWLKLDLIHHFFEVLSEDGRQDKSRFEFWRTYHHRMDDVYFALGSHGFWSKNPDIEKLRRSMDGRLLRLNDTNGDNNAFIMRMGDIIVVEFSKKGNAAYFYRAADMPLHDGLRTLSTPALKRDPPGRQMRHAWARGLSWQEQFARALGDHQTDSSHRSRITDPRASIAAFARANGITLEDHTTKGGSFWLITDDADPDIAHQLTKSGFKYRPGRGWWRQEA
jgi:hypothetical protein